MAPLFRVILGIIFCCTIFLLPTGVAILRNSSRTGAVLLWNTLGMLLFGIGWLVALVVALTDGGTTTIIVQNVVNQGSTKEKKDAE